MSTADDDSRDVKRKKTEHTPSLARAEERYTLRTGLVCCVYGDTCLMHQVACGVRSSLYRLIKDQFDVEAWELIIGEATRRPIDQVGTRELWERVLTTFPTAPRYWRAYIDAEITASEFGTTMPRCVDFHLVFLIVSLSHISSCVPFTERAEKLLQRCLLRVPDIDLYQCYLKYIARVKRGAADERAATGKY